MKALKSMLLAMLLPLTAIAQTSLLYTIAGSGTSFYANRDADGEQVGDIGAIQTVIDAIKADASGEPCEIRFGNGATELNIGTASINFDGSGSPGWGDITLSGKITNLNDGNTIILSNGTNVESEADIKNTFNVGYAIRNNGIGTLTISSGTISSGYMTIYNNSTGTIDIKGGTISASGTLASNHAVYNNSTGTINISGGTITAIDHAVRNNSTGTVNISGGTISATGTNGIAIYNYSTGKIAISGTADISSANTKTCSTLRQEGGTIHNNAGGGTIEITAGTIANTSSEIFGRTICGGGGTINISGGTVSASGTTGVAIESGKITISGDANITSENIGYNGTYLNYYGTIYASQLEITGGTISNTAGGNAIYNDGTSSIVLGGNPTIIGHIKNAGNGNLSLITDDENVFAPSVGKNYSLDFVASYSEGYMAVINGKNFSDYFTLVDSDFWGLTANNNHLIVTYVGPETDNYFILGNYTGLTGSFMAIKNGVALRTGTIQSVINAIKTDANGEPCEIQFGNGTTEIYIGGDIQFGGSAPGFNATITGKITSSATSTVNGAIIIGNGANINFKADITNTNGNGITIGNGDGTLTISGGTISATEAYAVVINSIGSVVLSGSPTINGEMRIGTGNFSVIAEGANAFTPGEKIYTLSLASYAENAVAVENGKNFLANFELANDSYSLAVNDNDLVVAGNTPIRHPQIASGNIRAYAARGSIVLENLPSEAKVEVYSLQGKRIYSANSENSQILAILIQTKGVYIAKIGTQSFRVAVK